MKHVPHVPQFIRWTPACLKYKLIVWRLDTSDDKATQGLTYDQYYYINIDLSNLLCIIANTINFSLIYPPKQILENPV